MVEEKNNIKKQVLEETKEYFTEEGGGVYDCRLCGESGFMQFEDLVSHLYEEHPREFCDGAIDLAIKLTREEEDKVTAKIQKTLIASTQLLNKQIIQYEIEKEHEKVLKIIDNIDDEEFEDDWSDEEGSGMLGSLLECQLVNDGKRICEFCGKSINSVLNEENPNTCQAECHRTFKSLFDVRIQIGLHDLRTRGFD